MKNTWRRSITAMHTITEELPKAVNCRLRVSQSSSLASADFFERIMGFAIKVEFYVYEICQSHAHGSLKLIQVLVSPELCPSSNQSKSTLALLLLMLHYQYSYMQKRCCIYRGGKSRISSKPCLRIRRIRQVLRSSHYCRNL